MTTTLKLIVTALVVIPMLGFLYGIWSQPGPDPYDHQTNLPLGLYARTKGKTLEVGHYDEQNRWHRDTPRYSEASWLGVSVPVPHDPSRLVSVFMFAPYYVRVGDQRVSQTYHTTEGPVVRIKRTELGE